MAGLILLVVLSIAVAAYAQHRKRSALGFFALSILLTPIVGFVVLLISGDARAAGPYICRACGVTGKPKRSTRGSLLIEIVLWLCFLVPGITYSLWRMTTRYRTCGSCGSSDLIPLRSPLGQKLAHELARSAPQQATS